MYVNLSADGLDFMAVINARFPLKSHEDIELTLNMDKVHLFEKGGDQKAVAHTDKNATTLEGARLMANSDDED